MEYAKGGDLFGELSGGGAFEAPICRHLFGQMVAAIEYIHSEKIVHLDLKTGNILLDRNFRIKIADFGLALINVGKPFFQHTRGTEGYMAPEVVEHNF